MEELLFSSSRNVELAIARMQVAGAVFLTYKSLYYELLESVGGCGHAEKMREAFGPFPDDLPDFRGRMSLTATRITASSERPMSEAPLG